MSDSCTRPICITTARNAFISLMVTSFQFLNSDLWLGGMAFSVARAYSFVFSMMYCSTDVVKKSWKYSIGLALRESPMFTPGVAENVKEVGGRGCASIVL